MPWTLSIAHYIGTCLALQQLHLSTTSIDLNGDSNEGTNKGETLPGLRKSMPKWKATLIVVIDTILWDPIMEVLRSSTHHMA